MVVVAVAAAAVAAGQIASGPSRESCVVSLRRACVVWSDCAGYASTERHCRSCIISLQPAARCILAIGLAPIDN